MTENPPHDRHGDGCQFCGATGRQRWTLCDETARGPYCGIECLEADQVARALVDERTPNQRKTADFVAWMRGAK